MNHKLVGALFILLGIGFFGDSAQEIYQDSVSLDFASAMTIFKLLFAIPVCIYGYKTFTQKNETQ